MNVMESLIKTVGEIDYQPEKCTYIYLYIRIINCLKTLVGPLQVL